MDYQLWVACVDLNDLETILSHMRLTAGHGLANRRVIGFPI